MKPTDARLKAFSGFPLRITEIRSETRRKLPVQAGRALASLIQMDQAREIAHRPRGAAQRANVDRREIIFIPAIKGRGETHLAEGNALTT